MSASAEGRIESHAPLRWGAAGIPQLMSLLGLDLVLISQCMSITHSYSVIF